jgi:hypothetical protein
MVAVRARMSLFMNLLDVSKLFLARSKWKSTHFDQSGYLDPAMMRTLRGLAIFSGSLRR